MVLINLLTFSVDYTAYRYKIYMEGNAWSVSEKYILACDSMSLLINPKYYDFFTRSLIPMKHYWPVDTKRLCKSIKYAVDWGNNHIDKVSDYLFIIIGLSLIWFWKLRFWVRLVGWKTFYIENDFSLKIFSKQQLNINFSLFCLMILGMQD